MAVILQWTSFQPASVVLEWPVFVRPSFALRASADMVPVIDTATARLLSRQSASARATGRDFMLDATGDLLLLDGDLLLTTGAAAIEQAIRVKLRTFLGEWFLDVDMGVPYFERVLVKNPNMAAVEAMLREKVLAVEGVLALPEFRVTYTPASRELLVTFAASTDFGELASNLEVTL